MKSELVVPLALLGIFVLFASGTITTFKNFVRFKVGGSEQVPTTAPTGATGLVTPGPYAPIQIITGNLTAGQ